ncbi:hypothetical protein [Chitinophaga sp. S165]|uniref:hypothetical protein n=1 Tax=Chitinophaga sp. S165 TaxID=2135462 RepID=UPI000D71B413|nr:hypothetical protein [Chitinophaga sp. S165]PWV55611.1 hypothetical protein C7475_101117 [Chitinophaga sp. S165]
MRTMTQKALLLLFLPLLALTSRLSAQNPASYQLTVEYSIMGFGSTATCGSLYEVYALMQNGSAQLIASGPLDGIQPGEVWNFPPQTITFTPDNPVKGIATWGKRKISCNKTAASDETDYLFPAGDLSWFDVNVGGLFAGYNAESNMHITIKPVATGYALQNQPTEVYPAVMQQSILKAVPATVKTIAD